MRKTLFLVTVVLVSTRAAEAAPPPPPPKPSIAPAPAMKPQKKDLSWGGDVVVGFDSNVFLIDDRRRAKLDGQGRHVGMNSPSDTPLALSGRVRTKTDWGEFSARPRIIVFPQNPLLTHGELEVGLDRKLRKGSRAFAEFDVAPSVFKKNYFVAGTDTDGDGQISGSERRYAHGISTLATLQGGFRSDLNEDLAFRASGGLGYEDFASPINNRDLFLVLADGGLEFGGRRLRPSLEFGLELARAPAGNENVLDQSGADDIVLTTKVDHSYLQAAVEPKVRFDLTPGTVIGAGLEYRRRQYSSTLGSDPYRARVDQRIDLTLGAGYELLTKMELRTDLRYARNFTERPNDSGDGTDYQLTQVMVGFSARF